MSYYHTIHQYKWSFFFGGIRSGVFSRLGLSMRFLELAFSVKYVRSSTVFGGRLKRPLPCRIRSAPGRDRVRGLSETSEKCAFFFVFWAVYTRAILGSWHMPSLKNENTFSKLASFPNWLLISSSPHVFHGHTLKRLAYFHTTECCVVAFRYRISRLNTFVQAFVVFEGGRSLPNKITTPSVRADS